MEKRKSSSVSRRQFIRGIGISAGLLTLGNIDMAKAALLPKAKRSEKFNVIVIGTGLAGMVTAVTALDAGAKVAILEKLGTPGGNANLAAGLVAIPRENTQAAKDAYFEDLIKKSTGKGSPTLSRLLADQALDGIEWMRNKGVEMTAPADMAGYRVKMVIFKPGLYKGVREGLKVLREEVAKKGGKIIYETKAQQLIMDEYGAVVGVRAEDAIGLKDFMADAVVIATGGYMANREVLEAFVDPHAGNMLPRGLKTCTGDGLNLAREAGAQWIGMGGIQGLHVAAVSPKNPTSGSPFIAAPLVCAINKEGKRFVDEGKGYVGVGKATLKQPEQTIALVFDEELKKNPGVAASMKVFKDLGIDIVEANTLSDLAGKIGVPAATLEKTIADFNAAVKDGKALDIQPPKTAYAAKVSTPKFYAFYPLVPGITMTFGGIKINEKTQVQQADGKIIRNLYAAGECTGGLYFDDYIGGCSLCDCIVLGRVAGQEASAKKTAAKKIKKG